MRARRLLITLWLIDLVLIGLHTLHRLTYRGLLAGDTFLANPIFSMSEEGRLPDLFQYSKELAIVILLFLAFRRFREYAYLVWAFVFGYILLDDSLILHERIGYFAGDVLPVPTPFGLHPAEVAQLIFLGLVGITILLVAFLLIRRTEGVTRRVSIDLTILFLIAAFFGFGLDIVQAFVMEVRFVSGLITILEDGGEMIMISAITWYTYLLARSKPPELFASLLARLA